MNFETVRSALYWDAMDRRKNGEQEFFGLNHGIFFNETFPWNETGIPTMCNLSDRDIEELHPLDATITGAYFQIYPTNVAGRQEALVIELSPCLSGTQQIFNPGKKLKLMEEFGVVGEDPRGTGVRPAYRLDELKDREVTAYQLRAGIAGISDRLRL